MHISAKELVKQYENRIVLNSITYDFESGSSYALTGPSGSGKTTLLHILSGLIKPDSGSIFCNQQNIQSFSSKEQEQFRNQEMGFVFQFHHLLPEFTAQENVSIPLLIAGVSKSELKERSLHMLDQVGLADKASKLPAHLSGGEQQRVAIARAIVNQPKVIFADEPTGNLDSKTAEDCMNIFFKLQKSSSCTLIIATHDVQIAQQLDVHIQLKNGSIC